MLLATVPTYKPSYPMNPVFLLLLLCSLSSSCAGSASDVQCLKDLIESVGDPYGALSWPSSDNSLEDYICNPPLFQCWTDGRVMSLNLRGLGLQGSFPRGLELCASLTGLDLSGNNLTGALPTDIDRQLPFVTSLDLSDNGFSGEIPRGIGNMAYLNTLSLRRNRLTGPIPEPIGDLARLVSLDLAENSLSGPIPGSLRRFPAEAFAGNGELCGAPVDRACKNKKRVRLRLRRVNDASSVGAAVGFVVAFYFPQWFVPCGSLDRALHLSSVRLT